MKSRNSIGVLTAASDSWASARACLTAPASRPVLSLASSAKHPRLYRMRRVRQAALRRIRPRGMCRAADTKANMHQVPSPNRVTVLPRTAFLRPSLPAPADRGARALPEGRFGWVQASLEQALLRC